MYESRTTAPVAEDEHRGFRVGVRGKRGVAFLVDCVKWIEHSAYPFGHNEFMAAIFVDFRTMGYGVECFFIGADERIDWQILEFQKSHRYIIFSCRLC